MNIHMHVLLAIIVVNSLISIVLILKHDKKIKNLLRVAKVNEAWATSLFIKHDAIITNLSATVKVHARRIEGKTKEKKQDSIYSSYFCVCSNSEVDGVQKNIKKTCEECGGVLFFTGDSEE